jgi:benzoate membrane transport protein
MITGTGLCTIIVSFFLAHTITVAGTITAITSDKDAGPIEHRWVAAFLKGSVQVVIALPGGYLIPFLKAMPTTISGVLAGLAMLNLFLGAFEVAFSSSSKFKVVAFFAFIIAFSNIQIFSIGAPVWALLIGIIVSFIFERANVKSFLNPVSVKYEIE